MPYLKHLAASRTAKFRQHKPGPGLCMHGVTDDGASVPGEEDMHSVITRMTEASVELACLARLQRLDTLAYIFDMARLEAENIRCGLGAAAESDN